MSIILKIVYILVILIAIVAMVIGVLAYMDAQKKIERETIYGITSTIPTNPVTSNPVNITTSTVISGNQTAIAQGSTQGQLYATVNITPDNVDNEVKLTINMNPSGTGNLDVDDLEASATYTVNGYNYTILAGIRQVNAYTFNVVFQPAIAAQHVLRINISGQPVQ